MSIAIYGGSFNPPHLGHVEAVRTALRELKPDRLLIIPDRIPPHKELEEGSPEPEERLALCKLAFAELEDVVVSDMEIQRTGKSYSYDTVRELEQNYPGEPLILLMGTDMFLSFDSWYHFEYLLQHCELTVFARENDGKQALAEKAALDRREYDAKIRVLDHQPLPISSSQIREQLPRRAGREYLSPSVYSEIIRKRLYGARPELNWLREQVNGMLDKKRVAHVAGCEQEAIRLAQRWGEDPELAAEAGILHDITKRLSHEEQLELCYNCEISCDEKERVTPKLLHAKTGAAVARERFGVSDAVFSAIRWHTTGRPDMSLLEKIIYLADYIEPTRDFPGVEKIRELAYEDLDRAMLLGLKMTVEEIREKGEEPYQDTLDACAWYEARVKERSS